MTMEVSTRTKQEVKSDEQTRPGRTYLPNVDIFESDDALWLWADMPGVDEHSVDVHLENDLLSIEGRVALEDYEELRPAYTEYNIGNFSRRFRLSSAIDTGRIEAHMKHGVLELHLPKAEEATPKRIAVKSG